MKKTTVLLFAAAIMLSSCGITAQQASSDNGHRFLDGIYTSSPTFRTREEKAISRQETDALVQKTKSSEIYLFGDKKDTIMIPDNMSARIQFDQKVGGTVITIGENPYDWRWDLENNYGYYYGPYSIGSSWYWSRHYSPYWSSWGYSPWRFASWRYDAFYNPWYYSSWYSPWYGGWYDPWYSGWYDPWYYGGFYDPWYCGYYGTWHYPHPHHHGWYDPHHHHPGHGPSGPAVKPGSNKDRYHGLRAHTDGSSLRKTTTGLNNNVVSSRKSTTSVRRGIGTSSTTSRNASVSRNSASRPSATRNSAPTYRKPAVSNSSSETRSESTGYSRNSGNTYTRGSVSGNSSHEYNRNSSSSSYSRGSSMSSGGGYGRGGASSSSGGYSRGSSGSYRR